MFKPFSGLVKTKPKPENKREEGLPPAPRRSSRLQGVGAPGSPLPDAAVSTDRPGSQIRSASSAEQSLVAATQNESSKGKNKKRLSEEVNPGDRTSDVDAPQFEITDPKALEVIRKLTERAERAEQQTAMEREQTAMEREQKVMAQQKVDRLQNVVEEVKKEAQQKVDRLQNVVEEVKKEAASYRAQLEAERRVQIQRARDDVASQQLRSRPPAPGSQTIRSILAEGVPVSRLPMKPCFGERPEGISKATTNTKRMLLMAPSVQGNSWSGVRVEKWSMTEFIEFLATADNLKVKDKQSLQDVKLLDLILDSVPDDLTADILRGNHLAEGFTASSEAVVEGQLIRGLWSVLEVIMGRRSMLAKNQIEFSVTPHDTLYISISKQLAGFFRIDDLAETIIPTAGQEVLYHAAVQEDATRRGRMPEEHQYGAFPVEVKFDPKFPRFPRERASDTVPDVDAFNALINQRNLVDYMRSEAFDEDHDSVAQIATYQMMLLLVFGVLTTYNQTVFTRLDGEESTIYLTDKFDATVSRPFEDVSDGPTGLNGAFKTWTLWEVWIRFSLATVGHSRVPSIPEVVAEFFKKSVPTKDGEGDKEDKDPRGGSRPASSASKGKEPKRKSASGGGAKDAAMDSLSSFEPPSWADLWDERRFDPTLPIEVSCAPEQLDGDADLLATCRTGPVYRKRLQGRDCVFKVLQYSAWREELDGEKRVYPIKIRDELLRERDAYARLWALQGKAVARFVWHGAIVEGMADALVTEYAGESLPSEVTPAVLKAALESLDAVHSLGVLHGDVAERNFLLNADKNTVVMIDFAMAKFREEMSPTAWKEAVARERKKLIGELHVTKHADEQQATTSRKRRLSDVEEDYGTVV